MNKWTLLSAILTSTICLYATSYPRISVDEVFGSPGCGACVAMYSQLDSLYPLYADSAVILKFISGITPTPIYTQRYGYYEEIYDYSGGVPWSIVNGEDYDHYVAPYIVHQLLVHSQLKSPFRIELSYFRPETIAVEIYTDSLEFEGARSIVVLIVQDSFNSYQTNSIVMDSITPVLGDSVYLIPGVICTLGYRISPVPIDMSERTYAIFFVQDWLGTRIYNAFRTNLKPRLRFDFVVKTPDGKRRLCAAGDIIRIPVEIENWGTQNDTYNVRLEWLNHPPGWEAYLAFPEEPLEKRIFITAFNDSLFEIEVVASFMEDATFRLLVRADSIPDREDTVEFRVGAGGQALLVSNSPTPEDSVWYINFMNARGIDYFYWDVSRDGALTKFASNGYSYVVWFCGLDTMKNIEGEMRQEIGRYLFEHGGRLLITGAGIGRVNYAVSNFLENGLGARFDSTIVEPNSVSGVAGHFTGFYSGFVELPCSEVIHTSTTGAQIVLTYQDGSGAGVAIESPVDNHRCVWLAFPPERMTNETRFGNVMLKGWQFLEEGWTGIKTSIPPDACSIPVFPNPVNSVAKITLPSSNGKLTIYDISGRAHEEIVIENKLSVSLDFSTFAAGIYLIKYEYGKTIVYAKIAVVK